MIKPARNTPKAPGNSQVTVLRVARHERPVSPVLNTAETALPPSGSDRLVIMRPPGARPPRLLALGRLVSRRVAALGVSRPARARIEDARRRSVQAARITACRSFCSGCPGPPRC